MKFSITRAGHIEYRVTDLGRASEFYHDILGFVEIDRDEQRLYLGGLEEREHHGFVLRKADSPGVSHLAFRVADPDDLERLAALYQENGCPTRWMPNGYEKGQGRSLRVQDPTGPPSGVTSRLPAGSKKLLWSNPLKQVNLCRPHRHHCVIGRSL
jgi:catechol 2,3-dioxygenase